MSEEDYATPERVFVPLYMLPGNMEALLAHQIPCAHISLKRDQRGNVILMIGGREIYSEEWEKLGFQTMKSVESDE